MKKICGKCKVEKLESEFHFRNKNKGTRKIWCKACNKSYDAKWYKSRSKEWKEEKLRKHREVRHNNRKFLWEYLKQNPCVDCGESHPILLEFDHNAGVKKIDAVSNMVRRAFTQKTILKEIQKCTVRCVRCHRFKTAKDQGWYEDFDWEIPSG
jgi:hypothetical protein